MALQFASLQRPELSPVQPKVLSFFEASPIHAQQQQQRRPSISSNASDMFGRKTLKPQRKTSTASFPSSCLLNTSQESFDKTPASRKPIILCQKEVSFDLDHSPLPHKSSFFDLRRDEDVDMESDSTASMFSDNDDMEDNLYEDLTPKFNLRPSASNSGLFVSASSEIDSYFAIPTNTIPTKATTTQPMKSLSNPSILHTKPLLTPEVPEASFKPPAKAWGMPSFGPNQATTPVFPRHCKVRRTHSMFEHPEDVIAADAKHEMSSPADTCPSFLNNDKCTIKSFTVEGDPFRRITRDTLCEILDDKHRGMYDRHIVVDCRFEYEYEGGHIEGAINVNSKEGLEKTLLATAGSDRVLLIFHCEYSAHRGPRMAMQLRNLDRQANLSRYPLLHYPDIAILDGGYSHFFAQHTDRCYPQQYVEMNDQLHAEACEKELDRFKRTMRFCRTQSFTYGAHETSPMGAGAGGPSALSKPPSAKPLTYSPCSPISRTQSMFSSFKFPLDKNSPSMPDSSPLANQSLTPCFSKSFKSLSTASFSSFSRPSSSSSSSSTHCMPANDTTPTQPAARRRLGVLPKFSHSNLFP